HAEDLPMIEPGDLAALTRRLIDLEQLPVHAGADEQPPILSQQTQHQRLLAEDLAHRAVGGDAVQRVLAGGWARRRRRGAALVVVLAVLQRWAADRCGRGTRLTVFVLAARCRDCRQLRAV